MLKILRHLMLGFVMAFAVLTHSAVSMAAQQKAKIVLQVSDNDPAKWNLALNNARNAQDDLGKDNIDIEIVVYGPGIHMLRMEATTATRVTQAIKSGISVVACENTMTAQKVNKADMHDAISYVPAGVIQLMKRQQQGWAYIRP